MASAIKNVSLSRTSLTQTMRSAVMSTGGSPVDKRARKRGFNLTGAGDARIFLGRGAGGRCSEGFKA